MPKKDPQEITNFYERHDFAEITYSTQRGMEREEKIIGQEEEIDLARDERSLEDLANEGGIDFLRGSEVLRVNNPNNSYPLHPLIPRYKLQKGANKSSYT